MALLGNVRTWREGIDECVIDADEMKCFAADGVARATNGTFGYGGMSLSVRENHRKILNAALKCYYEARKNLSQYEGQRKKELTGKLKGLADAGYWWPGVTCLNDAFKHLDENRCWKDEGLSNYAPTKMCAYQGLRGQAPTAAVNFLNALDDECRRGLEALSKFGAEARELAETGESEAGATRGAKALKTLHENELYIETAFMLTAKAIEGVQAQGFQRKRERLFRITEMAEKVQSGAEKVVGRVLKVIEIEQEISESQELFIKLQNARLSDRAAATLVLIKAATKLVPVFGDLYGEAISAIPGLVCTLEQHRDELTQAKQWLHLE